MSDFSGGGGGAVVVGVGLNNSYRVVLVSRGGAPIAELVGAAARVDHITWELNAPGEAVYRMSVLDPQAATAKTLLLQSEVQIWRNGVLVFWGVPVACRADTASIEFIAYGLLYHFARRYFGPVYSNAMPQLLANPSFEAIPVLSGWTASSPAQGIQYGSPTVAASTTRHYTGNQCIKLTGGGDATKAYYIQQGSLALPTPARSEYLTLTLSAWAWIEGMSIPPIEDRGVEIQYNSPVPPTGQWSLINANLPQSRWIRLETQLVLPTTATGTVSIGLFCPTTGSIYYDAVRYTYEQKTGALEGEDWVDAYLRRVFDYGAGNSSGGSGTNTAWWGAPVLKSSLGMTFYPSLTPAGNLAANNPWDHENRGNIYEAMLEVVKRDKADFEITWNAAGTSRGLTPYVPRKGSIKRALALELGRNITTFTYDVDGRQAANDVTVVGRASGNTKEVGQAGGPSPTTLGGVQYELVTAPAQEVDGQGLIDAAVTAERQLRAPVIVPTLTVRAAGLLDTSQPGGPLSVGDVVPVRMNYGAIQENDLRRVVKMTLHPAEETIDVVLNVVA